LFGRIDVQTQPRSIHLNRLKINEVSQRNVRWGLQHRPYGFVVQNDGMPTTTFGNRATRTGVEKQVADDPCSPPRPVNRGHHDPLGCRKL
jgi:hypothetical protein